MTSIIIWIAVIANVSPDLKSLSTNIAFHSEQHCLEFVAELKKKSSSTTGFPYLNGICVKKVDSVN